MTGLGWCKYCHIRLFWDKRQGHAVLPYEDAELTVQHKCLDYQQKAAEAGHYLFQKRQEIDADTIRLLAKRLEALEYSVEKLLRIHQKET